MATPKQEKLIRLLIENHGKLGERKTLGEIMIEAGYSPESAKNPNDFINVPTVQEGLAEFIKALDDKRKLAITKLTEKKLEDANADALVRIMNGLTKDHQLLSGNATETSALTIKVINYGDNPAI